jgi:hypothetical protein
LNADNFYDLLINVVSLTTKRATINLKAIHESISSSSATPGEEETAPTEETNPTETTPGTGGTITGTTEPSPVKTKIIIAAIIIIIAAVILTIVLLSDKKHKKKRYYMYGY